MFPYLFTEPRCQSVQTKFQRKFFALLSLLLLIATLTMWLLAVIIFTAHYF